MLSCLTCNKALVGLQRKFFSEACNNAQSNRKNQKYQYQKARGLKRRIQLIKLKGGQCMVCNYSKNIAALCFHHRDPSQKLFKLDVRRFANATEKSLRTEADKCDLLCHNCHMEKHNPSLQNILS